MLLLFLKSVCHTVLWHNSWNFLFLHGWSLLNYYIFKFNEKKETFLKLCYKKNRKKNLIFKLFFPVFSFSTLQPKWSEFWFFVFLPSFFCCWKFWAWFRNVKVFQTQPEEVVFECNVEKNKIEVSNRKKKKIARKFWEQKFPPRKNMTRSLVKWNLYWRNYRLHPVFYFIPGFYAFTKVCSRAGALGSSSSFSSVGSITNPTLTRL